MTQRERLERKLEKRRQWAESRRADAAQRFDTAHRATEHIPLGQPILVGHHSEKRHRAALAKSDNNMRKGCESLAMADHHESKSDGIERQLDNSVFSDDPDAIEQLQAKIVAAEAERDRMKAINAAIRKGPGWEARIKPPLTDAEKTELVNLARVWGSVYKPGFPPYALTNLGANIRRMKERIKHITQRHDRSAKAEQAGGVLIQGSGDYCRITFAEKPARDILNALKAAGFHWGAGSWSGLTANVPESVKSLVEGYESDLKRKE